MTKKKVSSQLKKARALINKGWCKAAFKLDLGEGEYNYCTVGAIYQVIDYNWDSSFIPPASYKDNVLYKTSLKYLEEALELLRPKYFKGSGLEKYNDHRKTTKRDILDLYDVAIKLAQKDEVK